jgi:hypothetical protein
MGTSLGFGIAHKHKTAGKAFKGPIIAYYMQSLGRLLALPASIKLGWNGLPESNTLGFGPFLNYGKKSFVTMAQF